MKNIISLFGLLIFGQICLAQPSEEQLRTFRKEVDLIIKNYTDSMEQLGLWNTDLLNEYPAVALGKMYTVDTMYVEQMGQLIADVGSTHSINESIAFRMEEYDKLLNKYYKLLMEKLTKEDKTKLLTAQRAWLQYKDSEITVNNDIIATNYYAGGGTMWGLMAGYRSLSLISTRVDNLYTLLSYISKNV